jgi:hypothetical protein
MFVLEDMMRKPVRIGIYVLAAISVALAVYLVITARQPGQNKSEVNPGVADTQLDRRNIGISKSDDVSIRTNPSSTAKVVSSLKKNEEVYIFGRGTSSSGSDGQDVLWLRVVSISGKPGWVFGQDLLYSPDQEDRSGTGDVAAPEITFTDHSSRFQQGKLVHMVVSFQRKSDATTTDATATELFFVSTPGTAAYVLDYFSTRCDCCQEVSLDTIQDILGDDRKEVCLNVSEACGDGSKSEYYIYGGEAENQKYKLFGTLTLSSGGFGDLCAETGETVISGPDFVRLNGARQIKLTRRTHQQRPNGNFGSPDFKCVDEYIKTTETYILDKGKLVLQESHDEPADAPSAL